MTFSEKYNIEAKPFISEEEKIRRTQLYVEEYGIVQYKREPNDNRLIYLQNFSEESGGKRVTYKVIVRLNTMKEERRKLNKYYKQGELNR